MTMKTFASRAVGICVAGIALAVIVGAAGPSGPDPTAETLAYRLTMGDLMTAMIQPRHVKLWLAGQVKNWDYAEYETGNLGGAFDRLGKAVPLYRGVATEDMLSAFVASPLKALASAVKAKDERQFVSAYADLRVRPRSCSALAEPS